MKVSNKQSNVLYHAIKSWEQDNLLTSAQAKASSHSLLIGNFWQSIFFGSQWRASSLLWVPWSKISFFKASLNNYLAILH